jgi:hypothetical protein
MKITYPILLSIMVSLLQIISSKLEIKFIHYSVSINFVTILIYHYCSIHKYYVLHLLLQNQVITNSLNFFNYIHWINQLLSYFQYMSLLLSLSYYPSIIYILYLLLHFMHMHNYCICSNLYLCEYTPLILSIIKNNLNYRT